MEHVAGHELLEQVVRGPLRDDGPRIQGVDRPPHQLGVVQLLDADGRHVRARLEHPRCRECSPCSPESRRSSARARSRARGCRPRTPSRASPACRGRGARWSCPCPGMRRCSRIIAACITSYSSRATMRSTRLWRANSETTSTKTSAFAPLGDGQRLVDAVARPVLVAQLFLDDEHHSATTAPKLAEELIALEIAGETDDGHDGNSSRESWRATRRRATRRPAGTASIGGERRPRCGTRHPAAAEARPAGPERPTTGAPRRPAMRRTASDRSQVPSSSISTIELGARPTPTSPSRRSPAGVWRAANR